MCAVQFGVCDGKAFAQYDVEENKNSYSPENCKISGNFDQEFKKSSELFTLFAHGCAVNNNSRVAKNEDGVYQRFGEPTEAAIRVLATKMIKDNETVCHKKYKTIVQLDFESNRKCMSTVVSDGSKNIQFIKGAPERLLENCTKYFDKSANATVAMSSQQRQTFLALIEKQAAQG
jgi:magnesium-transporting ATPase (P-type)